MRVGILFVRRQAARQAVLLAAAVVMCFAGTPRVAAKDESAAEAAPAAQLDVLLNALTRAPDDVDLMTKAAEAALAADRKDDALWLFYRAIATAAAKNTADERMASLVKQRDALDPLPAAERPPIDEFAAVLKEVGRVAVERRLFVNAVQVLARLEGSREANRADAILTRVFRDKKAVGMLLDSAVPVRPTTSFQRIRRKSARDEAKHVTWKKAWKIKTKNYTVRCNDGWEIASRVSTAMERINKHYRSVFNYGTKRLGVRTKMCEVQLYSSRDEYVSIGGAPEGALAFYSRSKIAVVAYDPRSEGSPLSSLWSVLFHEASHQFTDLISPGLVPAWLNEGTASYFEGASLRADGGIETNLVPMGRLTDLVETLRTDTPALKDVVSYHRPGSYAAEYYPVGWGLVYFMRNYENEEGELVYRPHYDAFMDSYRVDTPEPTAYDRFVQHFVTDPKEEDVATFEDFLSRFRNWILDLNDLHAGPSDRADAFVAIGKRQLEQGHAERAEESFRNALRKAPDHVGALLALAELAVSSRRNDEAVARLREILEQVARYDDSATGIADVPFDSAEALAAAAAKQLAKVDSVYADVLARIDPKFGQVVLERAEAYRVAGFPRNAVRILRAASTLLDGHPEIDREAQTISEQAGLDVLLWRAIPVTDDLDGWWCTKEWKAKDGAAHGKAVASTRALLYQGELPARYRFEATIAPTGGGEDAYYGILFGVDPDGAWDVAGVAGDWLEIDRLFHSWERLASPRGLDADALRECRIAVEVRPGRARFFVNGELSGEQDYPPGELRGGIGLVVSDAAVKFSNLRVSW